MNRSMLMDVSLYMSLLYYFYLHLPQRIIYLLGQALTDLSRGLRSSLQILKVALVAYDLQQEATLLDWVIKVTGNGK